MFEHGMANWDKRLKITEDHFNYLRDKILPYDAQIGRVKYRLGGYSNKRYRWDLLSAAGLTGFLCDELYKYLYDSHVDSALQRIVDPS